MMELILLILAVLQLILLAIILFSKPKSQKEEIERLSQDIQLFSRSFETELNRLRTDLSSQNSENRIELNSLLKSHNESQLKQASEQRQELAAALSDQKNRLNQDALRSREELSKSLENLSESLSRKLSELTTANSEQSEKLKKSMEERLEQIRTSNEAKLEEMRKTVDEKLHESLEKRLDASFEQVSKRLEQVYKGLGEMSSLAQDVGGLKKTLEGIKPRGILGELQLENLLEDILTKDQYVKNFKPNNRSKEVVEFAVCLPGKDDIDQRVYLPMDSKFPLESYNELISAYENGDKEEIKKAQNRLAVAIRKSASDISGKYIHPPVTTDFAILFLPYESLYAEVLRIDGLFEAIRKEYKVIMVGPSTTAALLNSLNVGFRTLAIQKKSSEVWDLLAQVKKQFGLFGDTLKKTKERILSVGRDIEDAEHRSRQIAKRLNKVEQLPNNREDKPLLEIDLTGDEEEDGE